jgi:YVTN family beta-propeller protein
MKIGTFFKLEKTKVYFQLNTLRFLKFHFFVLIFLTVSNLYAQESYTYFSPTDIELDSNLNQLFVAGKTANEIRSYRISDLSFQKSIITNLPPKALKIAGENLLIACSYSEGELLVLDKKSFLLKSRTPVGHGACDVLTSKDYKKAFIANQFSNDISVVDLKTGKETNRIPVLRQPMQIEISKDGRYLFVANFLTAGRADVDTVTSEVTIIDLSTEKSIKHIALANGSNALRGMSISADGKYVFVSHNLGRFQVPTTQLEQGWMNTSALSVIDATALEYVATVLLDEPEFGAAGSWGVDCSNDFIFVAHSGTHDFSIIDYKAFVKKLESHPEKETLSYNLKFLSGIRKRVQVNGNGPRAIKVVNDHLYVGNYFSDNINVLNLKDEMPVHVSNIMLSESNEVDKIRLGEMYFNDASYCFQSWQSCTGCHPNEARTDGLNWDLMNDGMGNSKNCKSMLLAHETPPSMITGIRPNAEAAVRAGFRHIQFVVIEEEHAAAVDAYLKSLAPIPSPLLIKGELNPNARQGKLVFEQAGCGFCHSGPYYTDLKKHEMGIQGAYDHQNTWDTPTLIEVWRTGPYLHDGRCSTLHEVFDKEKHGLKTELSKEELDQLVEYVLSL